MSLGEKNNVDSNLMRMLMYKEGDDFFGDSMVYGYDGDLSAEHLRNYYSLDSGGNLTWDADIYQKFEVPPALPWIQSLIDRDVFAKNDYKDLDSARKVLDYAKNDKDFVKGLIATERSVAEPIRDRYDSLLEDVDPVRVDVGKMYFVTSHKDLESWLKVMVRNRVKPKGILLYDDEQVIMENFASDYEGNHEELGAEIGSAVGVDRDFWMDKMGFDPEKLPRSGNKGQVLLESAVKRDKSIRMVDGELVVV